LVGDYQAGCCGFSCRGFGTRDCFLLGFPRSLLRGCCGFDLRVFRPGRLPGGGHCGLRGRLRGLMRRGIRVWVVGWVRRGLDDTLPSDVLIPPLAKVLLLGRKTGPLSFWSGRLGCGDDLSAALGRLLSKRRLRLLPLYTAAVFRCVVSPAATAHRLVPLGRTPTGKVGAPQATHRSAYPQLRCVWQKRWQRLHCSGPLGARYDSTDTRRPQCSVSDRTLDTSGPRATDTMKWGVGGRSLAGS